MKYCPRCKNNLNADQFWKNLSNKDGLGDYCITCMKEYKKLKGYPANYPNRIKYEQKSHHYVRRFGLTYQNVQELIAQQNGTCPLCETKFGNTRATGPCIDHDHSCCPGRDTCGKCIRGVIC